VTETAAVLGCLVTLLAAGLVERLLRDRAHARVPIRVHVNGTRGKSTVTRLVAAALRAHGVPTLARVSGTEARIVLPDGTEGPVRRLGPANVREELRFLLLARRLGARAVVVECMAIRPDLQHATEREMVRATIGVVTNVRTDHTEVMGKSLPEIAASLASTVPRDGVLVLGAPDFVDDFRDRAEALGTRVVVAGPPVGASGAPWLDEDTATALEVTRLLGVPDDVALRAMSATPADPGAFREHATSAAGRELLVLDARAANDPESFALLCGSSRVLGETTGPVLAVFNHRHDRPDRLRRFAPALAALPGANVLLTGDRPAFTLSRAARRAGGPPYRFVPVSRLREAVEASGTCAVVLCGNTRGLPVAGVVGGSRRG
jgi:poly-gamma-glutamate synthase PgsB/CapB